MNEDPLDAARGITWGMLIALALWALALGLWVVL